MNTSEPKKKKQAKAAVPFVTITIESPPVVKRYLENNFGSPAMIPEDHILHKFICALLSKPSKLNRRGRKCPTHENTVEIGLNGRDFKHDGFEISPLQQRTFNTAVENFIKVICRHALDAALIHQDKQINWKERYFDILKEFKLEQQHQKRKKELRKELDLHKVDMKTAIDTVIYDYLKLDVDVLPYDTVKKDYYRYRSRKKVGAPMSPEI